MKNFPFFTTEHGVAALTLREIPYQGKAYIKILDTQEPEKLLDDCLDFCHAVGAGEVFASGHHFLEKYPLQTALWQMRCFTESIGETNASLFPVQEETAEYFRSVYNEKIRKLPNSVWMDDTEMRSMLKEGDGYFVHKDGKLLGIGRVKGEEIRFVASIQPGAGADVVRALAHAITGEIALLEVVSINQKALDLYTRLGFVQTAELSRWYKIK